MKNEANSMNSRGGYVQSNQSILYGVIVILVGVLIGLWVGGYSVNNQVTGMMRMMGVSGQTMGQMGGSGMMGDADMMENSNGMEVSMNDMMSELSAVTGTERDEQFLRMMIVHHQGAIAMAERVLETTERPELKTMADAIISAQSVEIDQMKTWLEDWYNVTVSLEAPSGLSQSDHLSHHQS